MMMKNILLASIIFGALANSSICDAKSADYFHWLSRGYDKIASIFRPMLSWVGNLFDGVPHKKDTAKEIREKIVLADGAAADINQLRGQAKLHVEKIEILKDKHEVLAASPDADSKKVKEAKAKLDTANKKVSDFKSKAEKTVDTIIDKANTSQDKIQDHANDAHARVSGNLDRLDKKVSNKIDSTQNKHEKADKDVKDAQVKVQFFGVQNMEPLPTFPTS